MEMFLAEVPYQATSYKVCSLQPAALRDDFVLFSESNSRFIVEVEKKKQKAFEKILKGIPFGLAGCVSANKEFKAYGLDGKICVQAKIGQLKEAWQKPLRW